MGLALAAAISLASGYLLVAAGWPRSTATLSAWLMKLSLAAGFGLGISSASYFLVLMSGSNHFLVLDDILLVVLSVLYVLARVSRSSNPASIRTIEDFPVPAWLRRVLLASLTIAIAAALSSSVLRMRTYPHGDGWDAFAIWNLHARFLFLGGPHWREGFSALIPWSHPDYPLLLPAATARFWTYLGDDSPYIPAILGFVFTFGTLILLVSSLAQLRGRNAAVLAGVVLSSTPLFIEQGSAQYADVPLSFFILASMVLLHFGFQFQAHEVGWRLCGPWALSGLAAAFAAWTKNEGLLFLIALVLAQLWTYTFKKERANNSETPSEHNWKGLLAMLLGAVPVLAVIGWFKHSVAAAGDMFSSPAVMVDRILTPSRYLIILRWYAKEFLRFGDWWMLPGTVLLVFFYFLTRTKSGRPKDPTFRASVATLGLTLAGYFAIYLITPRDLHWHLRFSLNRLFLQLWPASIFLFFLFAARQIPAQSDPNPSKKCEEL